MGAGDLRRIQGIFQGSRAKLHMNILLISRYDWFCAQIRELKICQLAKRKIARKKLSTPTHSKTNNNSHKMSCVVRFTRISNSDC